MLAEPIAEMVDSFYEQGLTCFRCQDYLLYPSLLAFLSFKLHVGHFQGEVSLKSVFLGLILQINDIDVRKLHRPDKGVVTFELFLDASHFRLCEELGVFSSWRFDVQLFELEEDCSTSG